MLLIVMDDKIKWQEVLPVPSTISEATKRLCWIYSPVLVYQKALSAITKLAFLAQNFLSSFTVMVFIVHIRTASYHSNSNGLSQRWVWTVKSALKKKKRERTFAERLAIFMFNYRNTPMGCFRSSPTAHMFGRSLDSHLDLLKSFISSLGLVTRHTVRLYLRLENPSGLKILAVFLNGLEEKFYLW